ncbi:glycine cleavage system aminomethyltransferase GcvT [Actinorugispora endophytica]|uniref:Aminomethyltransferase n=1 Tax=Actinorugispora endophytica TaxID=1605990 RepID=A0A4R6UIH4_9ACTN|nr:glycine cleavage system aminomethyltransferase GcvT [Actinorugispora endophytica]TDQ46611.1 aminomethyltransferase [Actinorugispora endophytica]
MSQAPVGGARRTPLHEVHEALNASLVDFAGWLMPLRYGSESAEHRAVREAAGLFDLSHMGEILVRGPQAAEFLDYALVGQLSAVGVGRARYTMITADHGGVLDDLIVYRLAEEEYLVVANAANSDAVLDALVLRADGFDTAVTDESAEYALIALQGPGSTRILAPLTDADLAAVKYYAGYRCTVAGHPVLLARTGYTGEDGFELFVSPESATAVWDALAKAGEPHGLLPAGLSARDTLRLEAGMPLYGNELSLDLTPYEAGLGRVVKLDKPGDFVGRAALTARAESGPTQTLVGLVGRGRRVPRKGYGVLRDGVPVGAITSGAPSPSLGKPIAIAYIAAGTDLSSGEFAVDVRGRAEVVDVVELPFYKRDR